MGLMDFIKDKNMERLVRRDAGKYGIEYAPTTLSPRQTALGAATRQLPRHLPGVKGGYIGDYVRPPSHGVRPIPTTKLPGGGGLSGESPFSGPSPIDQYGTNTPGVGGGGLGGLSVQDFADLHGQEVKTPTLGEEINKRIQEQVYKGDEEAEQDSAAAQQGVRDFMGGYRASQDQRIGTAYHPALSGIRGTARDISRGLAGISQAEAARAAKALATQQSIAKTNADTARAGAAVATSQAAMSQAETAIEKVKVLAKNKDLDIAQEKWDGLLRLVRGPIEEYVKMVAMIQGDVDPAKINAIVSGVLASVKDSKLNAAISEAVADGSLGEALSTGEGAAAPAVKPPMTLDQLLAKK